VFLRCKRLQVKFLMTAFAVSRITNSRGNVECGMRKQEQEPGVPHRADFTVCQSLRPADAGSPHLCYLSFVICHLSCAAWLSPMLDPVSSRIIHEEDDFLVLDKPAHLLIHPTKPGGPRTLWSELCELLAFEIKTAAKSR